MRRRSFSAFNALRSVSLLVLVSFFVLSVLMEAEAKEEEEEEDNDEDEDDGGVEFVGFSDAFEDELFCVADGA